MKFINGELILENDEEISTALSAVAALHSVASYALDGAQKALPYSRAISTEAQLQSMRDNVTRLEGKKLQAANWLKKAQAAREGK